MKLNDVELDKQYLFPRSIGSIQLYRPCIIISKKIHKNKYGQKLKARFVLDDFKIQNMMVTTENGRPIIKNLKPLNNWYDIEINKINNEISNLANILSNLIGNKP